MKNIVWVDKCKSAVETAYSDFFKEDKVKIHAFDNYDEAFNFLKTGGIKIDLVVSGYCTFFWIKALKEPVKQDQVCFTFFEKIHEAYNGLPFVLFSSIAHTDFRTIVYEEIESFYSISKDDPKGLQKIKNIVFGGNETISANTKETCGANVH